MKKIFFLIFLNIFFYATHSFATEPCERIFNDGNYQEYLDDIPPTDFYSAFHIVVGNDGRCEYGWEWNI